MRSALLLVTTLVAVLALGASSALAASVGKSGGVITVTGTDADEFIVVAYDAGEDNYVFSDPLTGDVAFTPVCTVDDDNAAQAQCPAAGTTSFVLNLAGGADATDFNLPDAQSVPATINGGAGDDDALEGTSKNDQINGESGEDRLAGEGGEDQLNGGDGDDQELSGGEGNDTINGGAGDDSDIDANDGNDIVNGGSGNDNLDGDGGEDVLHGEGDDDLVDGGLGADQAFGDAGDDLLEADPPDGDLYDGGDGFDTVDYENYDETEPVNLTLDGQANDGFDGENDNALNVEDVLGGDGGDTIRGSDASESSIMRGGLGNDTINPGTLEDVVFGEEDDDAIDTRDGFTDRVSCGSGTDTADVDSQDLVSSDCETVNVEQRASARDVPEDAPPTVTFTSPAQGANVAAPTTLTADAFDDRGVARVLFVDEERTVCTDDTAPYTCDYQPRDEDVGRNTLTAVAIDTANQSGFSTRTVRVPRFTPGVTIRVRPARDLQVPFRFRTTGRITLPAGVNPAFGCKGTVTVQIKSRGNTISTRRARVNATTCRYSSRVSFRVTRRLVTNRLTVRATFGGNDVLVRRLSRRVGVRVRR